MDARRKVGLTVAPLLSALMLGGCVSQSDYDALKAQNETLQGQNQQLREQLAAEQTQVGRLQEAIKYTINSDLLFPPGNWTMKERGKRVMADMAAKLAPGQRAVMGPQRAGLRNQYVGDRPGASRPGRHVQRGTLAKASRKRYAVAHLAGRKAEHDQRAGLGRSQPGRLERHAAGSGQEPSGGRSRSPPRFDRQGRSVVERTRRRLSLPDFLFLGRLGEHPL